MEEAAAVQALEESFEDLERAVEERQYAAIEPLLQRQRSLLSSLPAGSRTEELARRGYRLTHWAITMIKIQRSGYARSLTAVLNAKRLDSQYSENEHAPADLISLTL